MMMMIITMMMIIIMMMMMIMMMIQVEARARSVASGLARLGLGPGHILHTAYR